MTMLVKYVITSGAVVMNTNGEILLKKDPKRGWELPGGQVEEGEAFQETVIREVKEETGIDIEVLSFCGVSQEISNHICNMWWLAKALNDETKTSEESLEVVFCDVEEALYRMGNENFRQELCQCLKKGEHPFCFSY
ncbi:NUDIX hydrolase [Priestia taiwanensis]|uniref:Nudix hydrolase domain-containing protein n=1 Tax=Priestia taiwanensis TaxID=1347902 RepID=A0A917AJ72_9BACI|nr:NUDIX hydrolase [Priestia taiwanensis]MBM7361646.1 8-oxo-dGTP pyrophosphatase MutT (NUDIX family) [Priestia taiwanensis]GGE55811.1 hypothetical protein GCM10007140_02700 [Priestia taiwanensis]